MLLVVISMDQHACDILWSQFSSTQRTNQFQFVSWWSGLMKGELIMIPNVIYPYDLPSISHKKNQHFNNIRKKWRHRKNQKYKRTIKASCWLYWSVFYHFWEQVKKHILHWRREWRQNFVIGHKKLYSNCPSASDSELRIIALARPGPAPIQHAQKWTRQSR